MPNPHYAEWTMNKPTAKTPPPPGTKGVRVPDPKIREFSDQPQEGLK